MVCSLMLHSYEVEERNIIKRFSTGKRPTKAPKLCTWGNKSTEKISEIIDIPAGKTVQRTKFAYINGLFFNAPFIRSVKTFVDAIIVKTRAKAFAAILNNIPML
jgi:hypothetical protein